MSERSDRRWRDQLCKGLRDEALREDTIEAGELLFNFEHHLAAFAMRIDFSSLRERVSRNPESCCQVYQEGKYMLEVSALPDINELWLRPQIRTSKGRAFDFIPKYTGVGILGAHIGKNCNNQTGYAILEDNKVPNHCEVRLYGTKEYMRLLSSFEKH